ncbi:uncharacterized protein E0L32_006226 [Thyridium curvatum]|uniref:Uncharacterized protein n=1 Tax=Thyridium curvatum TaxID=1093900 RepID=A0A507B021_9PEZI|nr:uncharacterized protein E0L32_006226 [Thyridium curvatum]TPX13253.1 hypothetical protein E0L32_006226 [Thyridium curvatum]
MIETENLRTASLYINNQLLSRGLLRDGQSIDFADPSRGGDVAATMGKVMSVKRIHDSGLLFATSDADDHINRQRDAEHRESLSTTLRTVRAESLKQTNDLQRLQEKYAETQRKLNISTAAEESLRAQLRAAEAGAARLKDEAAKAKALCAQTRAACANEVRKRDRQIEGLKKAVADAGRARGERRNPGITTITVTGDIGGDETADMSPTPTNLSPEQEEEYDMLRQETNSFLAELARNLSEENETLVALVKKTTQSLKEMSGFSDRDGAAEGDGHVVSLRPNPEEMAAEVDALLEHLRTILTNPSFVPIEEVVVRDEEIHRLRVGWEQMESRWQEAVHLIDGWRRRMALSGRPVNMEELKMGLRLSPVRVKDVAETSQGLGPRLATLQEDEEISEMMQQSPSPSDSLHLVPAPPHYDGLEDSDSESSIFEDDVDMGELERDEPNVQVLAQSTMLPPSLPSSPLPPPPELSPLKDNYSSGNKGGLSAVARGEKPRRRPGDFTTIVEEKTAEVAAANIQEMPPPPPPHADKKRPERPAPVERKKAVEPAAPPKIAAPPPCQMPLADARRPASAASSSSVDELSLAKTTEPSPSTRPASRQPVKKVASTASLKQRQQQGRHASPRDKAEAPAPPRQQASTLRPSSRTATAATSNTRTTTRPTRPTTTTRGRDETARKELPVHSARPSAPPPKSATKASPSSADAPRDEAAELAFAQPPAATSSSSSSSEMPPPPVPAAESGSRSRSRSPAKVNSRLPRAANAAAAVPQSPALTTANIAAKLAASERDADAARVRAKLRAARLGRQHVGAADAATSAAASEGKKPARSSAEDIAGDPVKKRSGPRESAGTTNVEETEVAPPAEEEVATTGGEDQGEPELKVEKPRKRERRVSKAASRRRSTLNPWELESLITGGAGVPAG